MLDLSIIHIQQQEGNGESSSQTNQMEDDQSESENAQ